MRTAERIVTAAILACTFIGAVQAQDSTPEATNETNAESPANPVVEEFNRRRAEVDAQVNYERSQANLTQGRIDAERNEIEAALGPLGNYQGATGNVTVENGFGAVEAYSLASLAIEQAALEAMELIVEIIRDCPRTTLVFSENDDELLLAADLFDLRATGFEAEITRSTALAQSALSEGRRLGLSAGVTTEGTGGSLAAVTTAVSTIANLLRTDYTIASIAVKADEDQLVTEIARAITARQCAVYTPGLVRVTPGSLQDNAAGSRYLTLTQQAAQLISLKGELARAYELLGGEIDEAEADRQEELVASREGIKAAQDAVEAVSQQLSQWLALLVATPEDKAPLLVTIMRSDHFLRMIRGTADQNPGRRILVRTNILSAGGTSYTSRNFFTGIVGIPYRISGATLVNVQVTDGTTGRFLGGGTVPFATEYVRPTEIPAALARRRQQRRRYLSQPQR